MNTISVEYLVGDALQLLADLGMPVTEMSKSLPVFMWDEGRDALA